MPPLRNVVSNRTCRSCRLGSVFYRGDILTPGHCFFASADGRERYVQPKATSHDEYLAAIDGLPLAASPEAFGLHPVGPAALQPRTRVSSSSQPPLEPNS